MSKEKSSPVTVTNKMWMNLLRDCFRKQLITKTKTKCFRKRRRWSKEEWLPQNRHQQTVVEGTEILSKDSF